VVSFGAAPATEQLGYWAQLSKAGLLTGISIPAAVGTVGGWGAYAPASKINGGGYDVGWFAGGALLQGEAAIPGALAANVPSGHFLALHGTPGAAVAGAAADSFLTANYAARIDTKIDDGVPITGSVLAAGQAACGIAGPPAAYQESNSAANCSLYIQFQN
jgi:hypothetical protein